MQVFFWFAFIIIVGVAIFAVQNSSAAVVVIKFFFWRFETSLIYTILGSICLGILLTLLIWIPTTVRASFRRRKAASREREERSSSRSKNPDDLRLYP